ncbi:MAG: HDOD domain-containing protein [Candidatus Kapabacteria bacterium]|nr:HDOD domain-containing protein [Candidatus Kapabacteria bacterium]
MLFSNKSDKYNKCMSNVLDFIQTQEFATLPQVVSKILELLGDEEVDVRAVAGLIETDAPLTLKLLKVANSPLYGQRTEVNTIIHAIQQLGINRLTNIVIGVSIFSKFFLSKNQAVNHLLEEFWWHSSCVGMISKSLSIKTGSSFKDTEFIGGLLHDIGKLALLQYDVNLYLELISRIEADGIRDIVAESDIFGINHAEVGAEIAMLWKLPVELRDIIAYHESDDTYNNNTRLMAHVRVADLLSEMWGAGFHEGRKILILDEEKSWQILEKSNTNMNNIDLEKFTFELEKDFRRSSEFLKLIKS